jgi:hypothetical protein
MNLSRLNDITIRGEIGKEQDWLGARLVTLVGVWGGNTVLMNLVVGITLFMYLKCLRPLYALTY